MNPETFQSLVESRLGRDFRFRWIARTQTYDLEQKTGLGTYDVPYSFDDPAYERVRDGYSLCLSVAPSPEMRCADCDQRFTIPTLKFKEVRCPFCESRGERAIYFVGYFPFCDRLLTHIEKMNPARGKVRFEEIKHSNLKQAQEADRDQTNKLSGGFNYYQRGLAQVPQFGYTRTSAAKPSVWGGKDK